MTRFSQMRGWGRAVLGAGMGAGMLLSAIAHAEPIVVDHTSIDVEDKVVPQQWLDEARKLRIYFGHQSVGANILDGLDALARQQPGRYGVAIEGYSSSWKIGRLLEGDPLQRLSHGGIAHFQVGRNGDGAGKVRDFLDRASAHGRAADVAMMKLCYVDFPSGKASQPAADPARLFATYRDALERLEQDNPKLRVVWWTAPLTNRDNQVREQFNTLVRAYAKDKGKVLFDLADIEAHAPNGRPMADHVGPVLYAGYTDDGGHLAGRGQMRAARAWWWLAARLAGWAGPEGQG